MVIPRLPLLVRMKGGYPSPAIRLTTGHSQGVIERIRQQIKLEFGVERVYFTAPTFVTREVSACRAWAAAWIGVCVAMTQRKPSRLGRLSLARFTIVSSLVDRAPPHRLATPIGSHAAPMTCTGIRTSTKTTRTTTTTRDYSTFQTMGRFPIMTRAPHVYHSHPHASPSLSPLRVTITLTITLTLTHHHHRHPHASLSPSRITIAVTQDFEGGMFQFIDGPNIVQPYPCLDEDMLVAVPPGCRRG